MCLPLWKNLLHGATHGFPRAVPMFPREPQLFLIGCPIVPRHWSLGWRRCGGETMWWGRWQTPGILRKCLPISSSDICRLAAFYIYIVYVHTSLGSFHVDRCTIYEAAHSNTLWQYGERIVLYYTTPDLCSETMSFNSNTYRTFNRGNGTSTSNIAEVAAHTPTFLKYSSGTRFEDFSSVHIWTVVGLKKLYEGSTTIESAPLTHQNSSKWCMVLIKKSDEFHLCFLLKESHSNKVLRAKLRADEILPSGKIREVFPNKWYNLKEGEKSETMLFKRLDSEIEENIMQNEIILQCEICIECIIQDELPVPYAEEPQDGVMRAVDDLLNKEVLTDFELHSGGKVLKAHRALLSVRSPYFAAMLQPHTEEAKKGRVEVKDVEPEVLKQVLLYMYTGVAPALKDMAMELMIAADKYQLQQLKRQCERHIAGCLNVDNAAATAANASVFSCDLLWDRAVRFIKHNLCEVMRSPGWAETVAAHPDAIQRISELMG